MEAFTKLQVRDQMTALPLRKVQTVYNALKLFDQVAYDDNVCIHFKLQPGQCVVFDNLRVLHARTGYTLDANYQGAVRHYHGSYVDWDNLLCKLNVLRKQLDSRAP